MADKPKADFSDVTAGSSATPTPAPPSSPSPSPAPAAFRTYTVVKGDTLSHIAKHFYGDANKWRKIFQANGDVIKNPDLIHPGQVLKIPN